MTCFYAGPDIIKSIHRHQRCKRHIWKFTMHRIASQLHPEKSRVKFFTCLRLSRSEIMISAFLSFFFLLLSIMHGRSRTSWFQEGFVAAACQENTMICCGGVLYGRHKIWCWGGTVVDVGVSSERRRRRHGEGSRRYIQEVTTFKVCWGTFFWQSKRQWACYNDNFTFKACWGISSHGGQNDSELAIMATLIIAYIT